MKTSPKDVHERAEAAFKKKEVQMREATKAMAEYNATSLALRERTARLRALRQTRDAVGKSTTQKGPAPDRRA